jgi:hypothetical protein
VSTTASNYIRNINTNFPVPGKDNPSQIFRNNWTNITNALSAINSETNHLSFYAVDVTNTSTSFLGNIIENVSLKNASDSLVDNGILAGDITIDYSQGSYQKITVTSGPHDITIINWPTQGKAGALTLSITPLDPGISSVSFVDCTDLGPGFSPYVLTATPTIFDLRSEYSPLATGSTVFVRAVNELIFNSTSTVTQIFSEFVVQNTLGNASGNHLYKINTSTGAAGALRVTSLINGNLAAGNVALVSNIIKTNIVSGNWSSPTNSTATTFQVLSTKDIIPGAKFNVITTSTILTVTSVGENTISASPPFPTGIGTGEVIFRNPTFNSLGGDTAFPILASLSDAPTNTSTGSPNVYAGSIQASANHLEVTFNDYDGGKNTFVVDTLVQTTVTNKSPSLANTDFVHQILPYGSIIMWYGNASNVPYGWALCNGSNGTPNLLDKFIVAAGGIYNPGATGGRLDTVLPIHNHGVTEPNNDGQPGHKHQVYYYASTGGAKPTATGNSDAPTSTGYYTEYAETGITIDNEGISDTTTTNLPPYFAVCYIMKVTGA